MKKKYLLKIVCILFCIMYLFISFSQVANATSKITTNASNWSGDGAIMTKTKKVTSVILRTVQIVGSGVAVIMLTYVAIKYMSAAPSERAEFKKSATAYCVGAIILFASTNLISVIATFATSNISTSKTA